MVADAHLSGDQATGVEPTGLVRPMTAARAGAAQDRAGDGRDVAAEPLGMIGGVADLLDTLAVRTARVVSVLREGGDAGFDEGTALPGWTRGTVACHLRYGAEASLRLTLAALHDESASWYPAGRPRQRPTTLGPRPGEDPDGIVRSLEATAAALDRVWTDLRPDDWSVAVRPDDSEDPRDLTVHDLLVLRVTELEVHGTDLAVGLEDWTAGFVAAALPFRLRGMDGRWPAEPVSGSWVLAPEGHDPWVVHQREAAATAHAVVGDTAPPVDARIGGAPRDVLALLLGRHDWSRLTVEGSTAAAERFTTAFPGP